MDFEEDTVEQNRASEARQGEDGGEKGQMDDQPFEGEDEEEDDVPAPDRSNLEVRPMKHAKTLGAKPGKAVQMADQSQSKSSKQSLG
jgi:hypothetical protein